MNTINEMTVSELELVAGGDPRPGQSLVDYLEEMYPDGEWVNGSFFPHGFPFGN